MKKYKVTIPWGGYSRGFSTYLIEVPDACLPNDLAFFDDVGDHNLIEREIVRDDTERDWEDAEVEEM